MQHVLLPERLGELLERVMHAVPPAQAALLGLLSVLSLLGPAVGGGALLGGRLLLVQVHRGRAAADLREVAVDAVPEAAAEVGEADALVSVAVEVGEDEVRVVAGDVEAAAEVAQLLAPDEAGAVRVAGEEQLLQLVLWRLGVRGHGDSRLSAPQHSRHRTPLTAKSATQRRAGSVSFALARTGEVW